MKYAILVCVIVAMLFEAQLPARAESIPLQQRPLSWLIGYIPETDVEFNAWVHEKRLEIQQLAKLNAESVKRTGRNLALYDFVQTRPLAVARALRCAAASAHCDWYDRHIYGDDVRDQDDPRGCGSCYIFASVGAFEASWIISQYNPGNDSFPRPFEFSEQRLLNCRGNCSGGYPSQILDFLYVYGDSLRAPTGIDAYSGAPSGHCLEVPQAYKVVNWGILGMKRHPTIPEIKQAIVQHGPVVAALYATRNLQMYDNRPDGEVYSEATQGFGPDQANHVVIITGWDDNMVDHAFPNQSVKGAWHIRNSWSKTFGHNGYAWLNYNNESRFKGTATNSIGYEVYWADAVATTNPRISEYLGNVKSVIIGSHRLLNREEKVLLKVQQ